MKISIGSDHAGYEYKLALAEMLRSQGHDIIDCGTHSADATDYPLWCIPAAEKVASGEAEKGIVVGGSGNGEAIAANKVKGDTLRHRLERRHCPSRQPAQQRQRALHRRAHGVA